MTHIVEDCVLHGHVTITVLGTCVCVILDFLNFHILNITFPKLLLNIKRMLYLRVMKNIMPLALRYI